MGEQQKNVGVPFSTLKSVIKERIKAQWIGDIQHLTTEAKALRPHALRARLCPVALVDVAAQSLGFVFPRLEIEFGRSRVVLVPALQVTSMR